MSIDWSDAAINEAIGVYYEQKQGTPEKDMRAALDAALAAQGCPKLPDCKTYADRAYADGRADALEEAASICLCRRNEIRALKEKGDE